MANFLQVILGKRLSTDRSASERLSNIEALAVLSSDVLSSVAYATEELLAVLVLGGMAAIQWSIPVALAIVVLLTILIISYRQLIRAYPSGGGAYTVGKENLGTFAGLIAASGLLIDYVLTVSVSIAAGVDAITSAAQRMGPYSTEIGLLFLFMLMIGNLRGVREAGRIFTLPTLLFVASMLLLIAVGIFKYATGQISTLAEAVPSSKIGDVGVFLILRAFASGCTALTGTEAISTGVRIFKPPEPKNARNTLVQMGIILGILFLGITFLAHLYGVLPVENETVMSHIARSVFGNSSLLYYLVQGSTFLILIMAANTSFSGFPRVVSMLGQDRYLPRQLAEVGGRLVYSNGIVALAILSAIPLVVFHGNVHLLIPLYAVGVFISFTLSQAGMVSHWVHNREKGWMHGALLNGMGAIATAIALTVIVITKFTHGAWLVMLLIPLFLYMFARIHKHYERAARELSLHDFTLPPMPGKHIAIVPVSGLQRATLKALAYAGRISSDVRAIYIAYDMDEANALQVRWRQYVPGVPLVIIHSPYRVVITEVLKYLDTVQAKENCIVTLVIPEFVPRHWWELLLHSQTAFTLKLALLFRRKGIPVVSVPHHFER